MIPPDANLAVQVAARTGLDPRTVQRALAGEKPISTATRALIMQALNEMGLTSMASKLRGADVGGG